ncbi:hypothetical protein IAT38_007668 [Cryptococcus sp. DSM 104549]
MDQELEQRPAGGPSCPPSSAAALDTDAEDTATVEDHLSHGIVDDEPGDGSGERQEHHPDTPSPYKATAGPANTNIISRPPSPPVQPQPHEPHPNPNPNPPPNQNANPPPDANPLPPLPPRRRLRLGHLRVRIRNWMREGARDAVGFVLDRHGAWAVVALILAVASMLLIGKLILVGASLAFPDIPWPLIINAVNIPYQTFFILSRPPGNIRIRLLRGHERLNWWAVRAVYTVLVGCLLVVFWGAWDGLRDGLREVEVSLWDLGRGGGEVLMVV